MAYTPFTGYSSTVVASFNNVTIPDWTNITIEEKGRPLPTPMDRTAAGDSVYTFVDDPLGGKTNPSANVTIDGRLSVTDKNAGAAGILQFAEGNTYDLVITLATGGDVYTLEDAVLKSFRTSPEVAAVVPWTMTFSHSTSSGAWTTQGA